MDCGSQEEGKQKMLVHMATGLGKTRISVALAKALMEYGLVKRFLFVVDRILLAEQALNEGFSLTSKDFPAVRLRTSNFRQQKHANIHIVVIDTLENIFHDIPSTFYDLLIVDECHRSINVNRKLIFDHFLCPRIGLTATPKKAIAARGKDISEEDLEILDTYRLFGCEIEEPDYQFNLARGIDEGFLAPYQPIEIKTYLTELAEEKGVEFSYILDPDERKKIELDREKRLMLEQLERKYLAEERITRIAEEIKKNTEYGEKMILFGVSQAHCVMLVKALNKAFGEGETEVSPRYAEAIISDNSDINQTLKTWFKKPNRKPYIAVSVDIMSTGIDIPCVRYIGFAALTKSVGKYIQMLGRGTRLDPKSGKFSFKVLDFVGLCKRMEDTGKGTMKPNTKIVRGKGGSGGNGQGPKPKGKWFLIDNPDPAHMIQRTFIHGDKIKVIDNIPINEARELFEKEAKNPKSLEVKKLKKVTKRNPAYEPTEADLKKLYEWAKNPEVYLNEDQLQKVYDFPQGSIWDFFLHAVGARRIPSARKRIERAFESYLHTYKFNDEQMRLLNRMRDIFVANILENKQFKIDEVFANPVYEQMLGTREDVNAVFDNKFEKSVQEIENIVNI